MCGRYTLTADSNQIASWLNLADDQVSGWRPRYNIAPGQIAPVYWMDRGIGGSRLELLRWGLVPSWAKDPNIGSKLINARSETIDQKPSFRDAFRKRRCWVLADSFYEWQKIDRLKVPLRIQPQGQNPFGFAGLWESWHHPAQKTELRTFTILTMEATSALSPIHSRMPVIIGADRAKEWINPDQDPAQVLDLMRQDSSHLLFETYPVSERINSPVHDDPACIVKRDDQVPTQLSLLK